MLDEVSFVFFKFCPIFRVCAKIDFVDSPEASHLVLVHLPDVWVLDREDDETIGVVFKKRLWKDDL